jgi:hypothetical protein
MYASQIKTWKSGTSWAVAWEDPCLDCLLTTVCITRLLCMHRLQVSMLGMLVGVEICHCGGAAAARFPNHNMT